MVLRDLFDRALLDAMLEQGYVRRQMHPELPLAILNYSEQAAYGRVWNDVTRQCRGFIYNVVTHEVVARPFAKFFNHGEPDAPALDLDVKVVVTDKADGSLGIIYPARGGYAVATRGSFTSEQALHATATLHDRYADWEPPPGCSTLVEIVYPSNRIVVDYEGLDDLVYLASIRISDGGVEPWFWPGPIVEEMGYDSLAHALSAVPRPNREGLVVYFPDSGERVKLKQADYVALHRILTGTNARSVWEYAAVRACADLIVELKHWGTYLGIDPARAAELLEVGDGWIDAAGIPDEFHAWVRATLDEAEEKAGGAVVSGIVLAERAEKVSDRRERYAYVSARAGVFVREVMRLASGGGQAELDALRLRAWREACPEPTAPFARPEAVA